MFVSKMMKMQRLLREDHEKIVQLKGMAPDNKIPMGILLDKSKYRSAQDKFKTARQADITNERIP